MNIRVTATERPKVDKKDFEFIDRKGELLVKPAGSVNGVGPITITKCEDCDIFILDHSGAVNIYDCTKCRIFIGPVDGSVQFEKCVDCNAVIACQQFRPTECKRCNILLMVTGEPGMVTCTDMKFGCFQYSYPELKDHFEMAGLNIHNNKWNRVHDFAAQDGRKSTWGFLETKDHDPFQLLARPSVMDAARFGASADNELAYKTQPVVPLTHGRREPWLEQEMALVVLSSEAVANRFYASALKHSMTIAETLCHKMSVEQAKEWIPAVDSAKMVGVLIGVGSDESLIQQVLTDAEFGLDAKQYALTTGAAVKVRTWFETLGADAGAHLH